MKVSRPETLKLDRTDLLEDVRARLQERLGVYAGILDDPSDPGWLLVEEVAWMVEVLSGQLDEYPWAVMRQLVHLMGGQLRPARPALGVVSLRPLRSGPLSVPGPGRTGVSFSSTATERREVMRYVPLEEDTPLVDASVDSVAEVVDGALGACGITARGSGNMSKEIAWIQRSVPSEALQHELVSYSLLGTRTKELEEALKRGVEALKERGVGWLTAEVKTQGPQRVAVEVRVDVGAAFSEAAPSGLAPGGDLEPSWGTVEGCAWTPPVHIVDDSRIPLDLRLGRPLPGTREGRLRVPDVPADFPVAELFVREPVPMPPALIEAIWTHFTNTDRRLAALRPQIERRLDVPNKKDMPAEARWVGHVLKADAWETLTGASAETRIIAVRLSKSAAAAERLRFAFVDDPGQEPQPVAVRAWGMSKASGLHAGELEVTRPWSIPLPPPGDGPRLQRVSALEVPLEPGLEDVLLVTDSRVKAVFLNAVLVGNLPLVPDNRDVRIERTVPTPVSLLDEDLVTPDVMAELLTEPLPKRLADLLAKLRLSSITVAGEDDIVDMEGVQVDPSLGELVLNAPDSRGRLRTIKPGTRVQVQWYRRTQGAEANVEADAISFTEQGARVSPRLVRVTNPMPTYYGQNREDDEAAVERLFGGTAGVPVLAADWEREFRVSMGNRGAGWMVRVWTYAERAHLSGALWPWDEDGEEDSAARRLRRSMEHAGPDTLVVFVGAKDGMIGERDLDWARRTIEGCIRRARERVPTVRKALVGRLWALSLDPRAGAALPPLPCYEVEEMQGVLVDTTGRRAAPPRAEVILNAPVIRIFQAEAPSAGADGAW